MSRPETLTEEQVAHYADHGYLVLPAHLPTEVISNLRAEVSRFEDEARGMVASNDRLDLEDSHTPETPRIRRIKRPDLISPPVGALLRSEAILAPVRDLIGPDVRLHTTKLNMKSAGYGAAIEWHQDFAFYPHTNDDVLAVGILLDDMEAENGPLMVFPGTHRGPLLDHHQDGVFVGGVDLAANDLAPETATALAGPAGSVTIHHGRILHGSALNVSNRDRRILFLEMMAADAFPIMGSMTTFVDLEDYNSRMLCGDPTLAPRLGPVPVRIPAPLPDKAGSIYEVQSKLGPRTFKTFSGDNG